MNSTWEDLANSARWRGIVSFIRNWIGPFDSNQGIAPEELDAILRSNSITLPAVVREWYLLATKWNHDGESRWLPPEELMAHEQKMWISFDVHGVSRWGIRISDLGTNDPPVFSDEDTKHLIFSSFSQFVAAMIMNDKLYSDVAEDAVELNPDKVLTALTCVVQSTVGNFYADAPLDRATVIAFSYPRNGPAHGKSRTPDGHALLDQLRR